MKGRTSGNVFLFLSLVLLAIFMFLILKIVTSPNSKETSFYISNVAEKCGFESNELMSVAVKKISFCIDKLETEVSKCGF